MAAPILEPVERECCKWKIISDPSGDFPLGGLFRRTDIAKTAKDQNWPEGAKWINIYSREVLIYQGGKLVQR